MVVPLLPWLLRPWLRYLLQLRPLPQLDIHGVAPADLQRLTAAPRRYDEQFLATVARRPSTVRCECPNHLADLLTKLNAFEQYSLECENSDNADAAIHALLYSAASQCRELLELALHRVLEHEGIRDD